MSTFFIVLSVIACGSDPVLEAARAEAEGLTVVPEVSAQAGAGRPLGPTGPAGRPEKPAPKSVGKPEDPGPGKPGEPTPGVPDEPPPGGLPTPEGPTTLIKGTIEVQDYSGGPVMIDAFDGDHKDLSKSKRVSLVSRAKIDTPGAFEIAIPEGGKVWISAYNDINEDGRPSREEPFVDYGDNPVFADQGKRISLSLSTQHGGKK